MPLDVMVFCFEKVFLGSETFSFLSARRIVVAMIAILVLQNIITI